MKTYNYAFSEWAEYRDVLFIARKQKPTPDHQVKFCLVKQDLTELEEKDPYSIADQIRQHDTLRSEALDVQAHPLSEVRERFDNMMWFCGVTDFSCRDSLLQFLNPFLEKLTPPTYGKLATGYRPDGGTSKFLFFTRHSHDARIG